ncbi:MAG: hypothetical protein MUC88_23275 [Planctomycetes bacterium]|jgi:hypothetical protein|nr:hypothetical protein [Planctomycetota bacterium]
MTALRYVSATLALLQLGWAAALTSGGPMPRWAVVVGAVLAATASAFPSLFGAQGSK